jgi:predicted MFS family arabinose efflux permease
MVLGALVLISSPGFAVVGVIALATGTLAVVGSPGSISIVNDLVPRTAVPSAISMVFLGVNVGRIAGGLLAGVTLALWPSGASILLSGILLAAPALIIWRLPTPVPTLTGHPGMASLGPLVEAARYAFRTPTLGAIMLLAIAPGALGLAYNYLLPVASEELRVGSDGLGILLACAGVGGLLAGIGGEHVMRLVGHGRAVFLGLAMVGLGLLTFGIASTLVVASAAMVLTGGGFVIYGSASLSIIQALASPELRGRLTALFALLYWGLMPLGALAGGTVAGLIGAQAALVVAGAAVLAAGAVALVRRPSIAATRVGGDNRATDRGV